MDIMAVEIFIFSNHYFTFKPICQYRFHMSDMEVRLRELYQFPVFLDVEYSLWYMPLSPNK